MKGMHAAPDGNRNLCLAPSPSGARAIADVRLSRIGVAAELGVRGRWSTKPDLEQVRQPEIPQTRFVVAKGIGPRKNNSHGLNRARFPLYGDVGVNARHQPIGAHIRVEAVGYAIPVRSCGEFLPNREIRKAVEARPRRSRFVHVVVAAHLGPDANARSAQKQDQSRQKGTAHTAIVDRAQPRMGTVTA